MKKIATKEIVDCSHRVAEGTFEYMKKKLTKETRKLDDKHEVSSLINIALIALASLDANIISLLRRSFKEMTNHEIDFMVLLEQYAEHLSSMLNEDIQLMKKEKMN